LGLVLSLTKLLLDHLLGALRKRREVRANRQNKSKVKLVTIGAYKNGGYVVFIVGDPLSGEETGDSPEVLTECLHSIHDCGI
jgi:hypothetical protein